MTTYQIGTSTGTLVEAETVFGVQPASVYQPGGERLETFSGGLAYLGYPRSTWRFKALSITNWASVRTTYLGGNYHGEVYVRTRDDADTWAVYRAIMRLPDPSSLRRWSSRYLDVDIEIILVEEEA